jgi:putative (di)nucleoside polyphosphate hydrolase
MKKKLTPRTSAGVIITDGDHVLLGHTTHSTRWDIPKGGMDQGETPVEAAVRELAEETGLRVTADKLQYVGRYPYSDRKDLELFVWKVHHMPDAHTLHCVSEFYHESQKCWLPELDAFEVVPWADVDHMVGKNLRRVLNQVRVHIKK